MLRIIKRLYSMITNQLYRWIKYPKVHRKMRNYNICSVLNTINSLIGNNKSLSRFGDGEFSWIFMDSKVSFEKNSKSLSDKLVHVLISNNDDLEITLPNVFYNNGRNYVSRAKRFYRAYMAKEGYKILPYLNINEQYYNTDISRIYTGSHYNRKKSKFLFNKLRNIWFNKRVLIIEGRGTRFGVGNNLFSNTLDVRRIECPINDAFEDYNAILKSSLKFLNNHENHEKFVTVISLGPTATVLAYDLSKHGFKSLDLGHLDVEYEWYLMGATSQVNIPSRYVNEVKNGYTFKSINNSHYKDEIVSNIK